MMSVKVKEAPKEQARFHPEQYAYQEKVASSGGAIVLYSQ
jgi:hypothetical protein